MNIKKLFILFLLPLLSFIIGVDWETLQIDSRASIDFPSKPNRDKETLWSVDAAGARFLLKIDDLAKRGLDSAKFAKVVNTPGILDAFSLGFLSGEGSSLISKKISSFKGYTVFEYVVDPGKTSQYKKLYAKLIFVGTKVYGPSVFVNDEKATESNREKFFRSFKLN
jgi:hypothetical protein